MMDHFIIEENNHPSSSNMSLADIMKIMRRHYNYKVAILADEYDAPLFHPALKESDDRQVS